MTRSYHKTYLAMLIVGVCAWQVKAEAPDARTHPVPKLAWSTYWGAGGAANRTVSVDPEGNVYMCGGTPSLDWPTTTGARHAGGSSDAAIVKFDPSGKKTANARMTVRLNGVLIHEEAEVPKRTTASPLKEGAEPGPLFLQGHGNPVRFRNVWVMPG